MNVKFRCLDILLNLCGGFSLQSYDATTHFETTVTDVLNMYTMITGKTVDLSVDLSAASAAEEY
jgi:Rab GDP dissociation inhibitor